MADTGVRVTELLVAMAGSLGNLPQIAESARKYIKGVREEAEKRLSRSSVMDLAEDFGVLQNSAVKSAQGVNSAVGSMTQAIDKVAVANELAEERIRQAQTKSATMHETLLDRQHKAHMSYVEQEVRDYEAMNRRKLSDLKLFVAQEKAEWDRRSRERRESEQAEDRADRERAASATRGASQVNAGRNINLTPAQMQAQRFNLWGGTSPSGQNNPSPGQLQSENATRQQQELNEALRQGALYRHQAVLSAKEQRTADIGANRGEADEVHREQELNEALRQGAIYRRQALVAAEEQQAADHRAIQQNNQLDDALRAGLLLREKAINATSEEGEKTSGLLRTEQELQHAVWGGRGVAGAGSGGPGSNGGNGGGGGSAPGWPGPPGTGDGFEGALRTISWGGGVAATVGRLNPAMGAGIAILSGAFGVLTDAAKGFFGLLTSVAPGAIGIVTEGFKLLISPLTGFFGLLGSLKDGAVGFFGELAKGALTLGLAYVGVQTLERALKTLIETTIGFNSSLELNHTALALIMKDQITMKDNAGNIQLEMQQVAIQTTFGFEAVQRAVRSLMQGGISVGNILGDQGLLGVVLDVGASMGTLAGPAIDHLTLALGQVQQAGHLTGEEMRQLRNSGVNLPEVFAIISRQTGITVADLTKMQVAGTLTSKMFFDGFKEWGKINFGGLAKEQANTFAGAMQQIQEAITIVSSRAVKPGFDLMSKGLQEFAALVRGPEMLTFAAQMAGRFQAIIDGVMTVVDGFRNGFGYILDIVRSTGQVIYHALQWINPFARHSPSLVDSVEDGVQRIINSYARLGREVPSSVEPLASAMSGFRGTVSAGFDKIDQGVFAENSKALAGFGPGAPEAYRAVQLAIRDLKDQASELTPEIIAQTNEVRNLTAEQKEWKRSLDEATLAVKTAKDEQRGMVDEIKGHRIEILQLNAQLLEAKRAYSDWEQTLQPAKDDIDRMNIVLNTQNLELDRWQLALKVGEEGLIDLRTASTAASDHLTKMQDALNLSKDALGGINDQLRLAKAGLKDILEVPIKGTNEYADKIGAAQEKIAKLQQQVASRKYSGASEASMKGLNAQLAKAEAYLHKLEADKKINIDIPEAKLKRLAESGGAEVGAADKEAQVKAALAMISPLEQAQKIQQAQVDAREVIARQAQAEAHAAKDTLDLRNASLDPLRHQVTLAEQARDHTQSTRDAMQNQLDIAKLAGQQLDDNVKKLDAQKSLAQEQLDIVQSRLDLDTAERVQPLIDKQEELNREYDAATTRLGLANEELSNLKTAQGDLVSLAQAWQSEIDGALSKAKEFMADEKRNKGGANKYEGGDQDRTAGADAALADADRKRKELERTQALARADMAAWMATWQQDINESLPWIGGFFERLTGFVAGVSGAMRKAAENDFPEAKRMLWQTLQDVAQGLPHQLSDWTWYFLKWIDDVGIDMGKHAFTILGQFTDWMMGKGSEDIQGGLDTWGSEFTEWIPPMAKQLFEDLQTEGTNLVKWIQARGPEYGETLKVWKDQFVDWVKPIWDPLSSTLGTEVLDPFKKWIGDQVPIIGGWVLQNWVGPMVDWVFKEPDGAWPQLKPKLKDLINGVFDEIDGKGDSGTTDPLKRSGMSVAIQIRDGFMDIVGTIAGEMAKRLLLELAKGIFSAPEAIVHTLSDALVNALTQDMAQRRTLLEGINARIAAGDKTKTVVPPPYVPPERPPLQPPTAQEQLDSMAILRQALGLTDPDAARKDGELYGDEYQEGVQGSLEMHSPSKVFQRIGENVATGFRQGVDKGMGGFINPFSPDGSYFSMGAGQTVRGGFSLNGARTVEEEPWYAHYKSLFPDPEAVKPTAERTFQNDPATMLAFSGGPVTPDYVPAPKPDTTPTDDGKDRSTRTYSYDESKDPTQITLVVQDSTIIGSGGMKEFMGIVVGALARDARFRRLFP